MVEQAASLGLDSQVTALLHGDPLERAVARVVVTGAVRAVDDRAKREAVYLSQAMNGKQPGST
ncbi:unannotated protein [freshwater metagenome]|uniref:Unannotated protein n=1 Tax=freshwater metagenome TaxID=449393 RepID=A0A6J7FTQ9_9ZZZZ|nr:hypothetical protein [Actinomycetota bacterium]